MAAGDRKIKLLQLTIPVTSGTLQAELRWAYRVENKAGEDEEVKGGNITLDLGTPAVALALTLGQIRNAALAKLNSDGSVPTHDSAS
jgi:hypothetical protein